MTAGWPDEAGPHAVQLGESIMPSTAQMDDVCAFYDRLAYRVVGDDREDRPAPPSHGLVRLAA